MIKTTIVWGTDREEKKSYEFATTQEYNAFIRGVDEANGWMEYEETEVLNNYDEDQKTNDPRSENLGAWISFYFFLFFLWWVGPEVTSTTNGCM